MGKLQTASREKEKKTPLSTFLRKTKTRSGVLESSFLSCRHCGEEFCTGETCHIFAYDFYERTANTSQEEELAVQDPTDNAEEKKRKRRKSTTKKGFLKPRKRKSTKSKTLSKTLATTPPETKSWKAPAKPKTVVVNRIRQMQKLNRTSNMRKPAKNTTNPKSDGVKPVGTRKSKVKRSIKRTKVTKNK